MFIGKKKGVFVLSVISLFILIIFSVPTISAQEEDPKLTAAYSCLQGLVKDVIPTLVPEQLAFSLLALSYDETLQPELLSALLSKASNNECWPSGSCKIKDTALAIIALNSIGEDTTKAQEWLLSKKKVPEGVEWYLEIDSSQAATCTITYDSDYRVSIGEDRKLSANAGPCLSLSHGGYWFKINAENVDCQKKEYRISCDESFYSTILYKKTNDPVWHISNQLQSASPNTERTTHSLNYFCFTASQTCDYEGTLWAAVALKLARNTASLSQFMPYILLFAKDGDNPKLFPETFLYRLTNAEYYSAAILAKKQATYDYWDLRSKDGKLFDTALVLFSIGDTEGTLKTYLLDNLQLTTCWGGVRTTAFLLWAGWPKTPIEHPPKCIEELNLNCLTQQACADSRGSLVDGTCPTGTKCCNQKPLAERICPEAGWEACDSSERCNGREISDKDGNECCVFGTEIQEQASCTDSDGGQNFGVKGTTTLTAEGSTPREDYCVSSSLLVEFYCDRGVKQLQHPCTGGCSNGVCTGEIIEEEQQGCVSKRCSEITIPGKTRDLCNSAYQTCDGDILESSDETGICCAGTPNTQICKNLKCSDLGKKSCEVNEKCVALENQDEIFNSVLNIQTPTASGTEDCCLGTCEMKTCSEVSSSSEYPNARVCQANKKCAKPEDIKQTIKETDNENDEAPIETVECCLTGNCQLKSCPAGGLEQGINYYCDGELSPASEFPTENRCCFGEWKLKTCGQFAGNKCERGQTCRGQLFSSSDVTEGSGESCCLGRCDYKPCTQSNGELCPVDKKCNVNTFIASDTQTCCPLEAECQIWPFDCSSVNNVFCITESLCNALQGQKYFTSANCFDSIPNPTNPKVCCTKSDSQTCEALGGKSPGSENCPINKKCSIESIPVAGGSCCFGECSVTKTCAEINGILQGSPLWPSYMKCSSSENEDIINEYTTQELTGQAQCCVGGVVPQDCEIIGVNGIQPFGELEECSKPEAIINILNNNPACCVEALGGQRVPKNCSEIPSAQDCPANKACDLQTISTPDNPECCVRPAGDNTDHCTRIRTCDEFGEYECPINKRCLSGSELLDKNGDKCCVGQPGNACELIDCERFGGNKCQRGQSCNGLVLESKDTLGLNYIKCCIGSCEPRECLESDGKPCPLGKKCRGTTFPSSEDTQDQATCCPNERDCMDWPVNCQAEGLFCSQQNDCDDLLGQSYALSSCTRPQVCCDKSRSQTCSILGGRKVGSNDCPINKNCSKSPENVADGLCCFGDCEQKKSCAEIGGILEGSQSWPNYMRCSNPNNEYETSDGQCCKGDLVYQNCSISSAGLLSFLFGNGGIGANCTERQKCSEQTISTPDNKFCCSSEVNSGICVAKNCSEIRGRQNCPINKKCSGDTFWTEDDSECCITDCTYRSCSEFGANCSINKRCGSPVYNASDSRACCFEGNCSIARQCNEFGTQCFPNERCTGEEREASNGNCCVLGQCVLNSCSGINGRVCPQGTICNSTLLIANDTQGQATCCQNAECIVPPPNCLNNSYFCTPQEECDLINGNPFNAVGCSSGKTCCTKSSSQNCSQLGGSVCSFNKLCSEQTISVADSNQCCLGSCNIFKNCGEMSGVVCPNDKKCSTTTTLANDTTECCVSGFCIRKSCEELGGQNYSISSTEKCSGTTINASDGTCCLNGVLELKSCSELNGLICSSNRECSELTIGSSDGQCCLSKNCQLKNCSSIGGRQCETGKICKNSTIPSSDTALCCKDECIDIPPTCSEVNGFCLTNQTCNSIIGEHFDTATCSGGKVCCKKNPNNNCVPLGGMVCGNNSKCINGPTTPVNDTSSCCFGSCTPKNCSEMSGVVCSSDKRCSSTPISASDTSSCCTGNCLSSCTNQSYFCILQEQCRLVGGDIQSNLFCNSPLSCCSDNFNPAQNCTQLGGSVCSGNNELCQGTMVSTHDTEKCCFGDCKSNVNITDCENNYFSCKTSCLSSEDPAPYNCTQGNICCKPKPAQPATCVEALKTCTTIGECDLAGGESLPNFQCPGMFICCSKAPLQEKRCQEKGGVICPASRTCDGNVISAYDTNDCCMSGICDPLVVPYPCEDKNYNCRVSCFDSEETTSDQCGPDKICCKLKGEEPEGKSYWWLWLLMLAIVLLIIAIIFRNKLRAFLFAFGDKFKKPSSALPSRPSFFPPAAGRPMIRGIPPRALSKPVTKSDIESENVFKKLREMGGK